MTASPTPIFYKLTQQTFTAMALKRSLTPALLVLVLIFAVAYYATPVDGVGGMVGGRTEIKDVKTNKEVQELGRYSVEEYNRREKKQHKANGGGVLVFSQVVKAEKQTVSGIKYYLKIVATAENGAAKTYDAVVVVKSWVHSKELLTFEPSPSAR
ncbi:unnamed protein product [Ilex paraguariensis]|uniref:Cystatin domain-containing protein n=1 Tax=Ilex paraguariensis TaxID=185542 RepID=A0ABC8RCE3_9AQUA